MNFAWAKLGLNFYERHSQESKRGRNLAEAGGSRVDVRVRKRLQGACGQHIPSPLRAPCSDSPGHIHIEDIRSCAVCPERGNCSDQAQNMEEKQKSWVYVCRTPEVMPFV
jgi:hypothetical protein